MGTKSEVIRFIHENPSRLKIIAICNLTNLNDIKKEKIASESLYIYAPLAHRVGLFNLKNEIEDLSLKAIKPIAYKNIKDKFEKDRKSQEIHRIMPHPEAVPMNGKEIARTSEEYKVLSIPKSYDDNSQIQLGNYLYAENCVFCHGSKLDGKLNQLIFLFLKNNLFLNHPQL